MKRPHRSVVTHIYALDCDLDRNIALPVGQFGFLIQRRHVGT